MIRIGHGFDVHKFGGHGPIFIAGVEIEHEQGLIAHSDGDVAIHALCDAILGALALGDIGRHFPDTDDKYKGIDSKLLLKNVIEQMQARDYEIGNIDLTIVAQAPKMAPFISKMQETLADILKTAVGNVNVKVTTTEKLGYTGRKEGIATHAVVILKKGS